MTVTSEPGHVEIVWQGSNPGVATDEQTRKTGFGTTLEKMMVQSLNGRVSKDWQARGLLIKLTVPRDAFSLPGRV
ncbi:hypothetical protein [Agrobacterium tumefaciens]|uniref:hypothetical protein n=1 Tax=Agrobacterium tumefaciens TaxID=358 RepID=UPI0015867531|nr:hypothetical protein [Agrobacterium tumefaciens]